MLQELRSAPPIPAPVPDTAEGTLPSKLWTSSNYLPQHPFLTRVILKLPTMHQELKGSVVWRYGMALAFVGTALLVEKLLQRLFPYPFLLLFFAAVMASAWFGGTVTGIFAVIISIVAVSYFFIPPLDTLVFNAPVIMYCAAFIVSGLGANWASAAMKKSEAALREARDQLEIRVKERTAELQTSNTELRKTQAELAHLSRALTMGELTSSIAHEITQPLTAVVINGDTCLDCLSSDPPNLALARRSVERIIEDGARAGLVLSRIRALFHKETQACDYFDMNEVIGELVAFLRDEAVQQRVSIHTNLGASLPKVTGDRVQLQQVLLNLVVNAIDATSTVTQRPRQLFISSATTPNAEIVIRVEDNGIGLNANTAERIFDPFFTTKTRGMGMGLSISRSIVESHGGHLSAAPRPACGAIFEFTVPIEQSHVHA